MGSILSGPSLFADGLATLIDSFNQVIRDALQPLVDFIVGSIFAIPRIETDGPFILGRPTGQPLGSIADFFTPDLFTYLAASLYDYVWIGVGGGVTITALIVYLVMIMLGGQYEMLQFDTSGKQAKNPIVGFTLILSWYPLYLLLIATVHGVVHAFVDVDYIVSIATSTLTSLLAVTAFSGLTGVFGLIVIGLTILALIIVIIPYVILALVMLIRTIVMATYLFIGPFLIAGSWSGFPKISDTCDRILWKSLAVAGVPLMAIPVLYLSELVLFSLFQLPTEATTAGVDISFGGAVAFAVLGFALLASIWFGFGKIAPAAGRAGRSLMRSVAAAGVIGAGSQLGLESKVVSRAAGITVRAGVVHGGMQLAGAYWGGSGARSKNAESSSGGEGDRGNDTGDDEWDDDGRRDTDGWAGEGDGEGRRETAASGARGEDVFPNYSPDELRRKLILNEEAFSGGEWVEEPHFSQNRVEKIAEQLNKRGVGRSDFRSTFNELVDLDDAPGFRQRARYVVGEWYNEEYDANVRTSQEEVDFEIVDLFSDPVGDDIAETVAAIENVQVGNTGTSIPDASGSDSGTSETEDTETAGRGTGEDTVETEATGERESATVEGGDYSEKESQLREHLRLNPTTSTIQALGETHADPEEWKDPVEDALNSDAPAHEALVPPDEYEDSDGARDTSTNESSDNESSGAVDEGKREDTDIGGSSQSFDEIPERTRSKIDEVKQEREESWGRADYAITDYYTDAVDDTLDTVEDTPEVEDSLRDSGVDPEEFADQIVENSREVENAFDDAFSTKRVMDHSAATTDLSGEGLEWEGGMSPDEMADLAEMSEGERQEVVEKKFDEVSEKASDARESEPAKNTINELQDRLGDETFESKEEEVAAQVTTLNVLSAVEDSLENERLREYYDTPIF